MAAGLRRLECFKDLRILMNILRQGFPRTKEVSVICY